MDVLVVGGTLFLGRHVVKSLQDEGHSVTLLNRGISNPNPGLPLIRADRAQDDLHRLPALQKNWDAIVDLSAYFPREVASLLNAVAGRFGRYVYCSTVSAYDGFKDKVDGRRFFSEDNPLLTCTFEQCADRSMETYGQRKAECERVAWKMAGKDKVVVLRPSVAFGAYDYTDRFAYWIWRAAKEKPFVLPDNGSTTTTMTYAPDLGVAFAKAVHASGVVGKSYNLAEGQPQDFRNRIKIMGEHLGVNALEYAVPVEGERLESLGVKPWSDLPLWIPKGDLLIDSMKSRRDLGFSDTDPKKALSDAADAFLREGREPKAGMSESVEAELLAKIK